MKTAVVLLEGMSPYSQSKFYQTEKLDKESPADYELRTWRDRMHVNAAGQVFIPPMVFKNCISEAALYLSMQIKGKGKATYTKHFDAGIMVIEPLVLPIKKEDVASEWLFVPASGKRGDGKRVQKCFPVIQTWKGEVTFLILDNIITESVFRTHIETAGSLIGIGRFRPRNRGYYGRFKVVSMEWGEMAVA
jgi:hypothetical protein